MKEVDLLKTNRLEENQPAEGRIAQNDTHIV